MPGAERPVLFVLAGVNGAGKSSIGGAMLRARHQNYFNPDEAARLILAELGCAEDEASALAWQEGKARLEVSVADRCSFAFETTLGGNTMPRLIREAAMAGFDVLVWYAGLESVERHVARVRARVAAGGHSIPEERIRQRWDSSRRNLIALMPVLAELKVFDNSAEASRSSGRIPPPRLVLHLRSGAVVAPGPEELARTPEWAKAIVARALQLHRDDG
jgi:predicted ABC-type ATPase